METLNNDKILLNNNISNNNQQNIIAREEIDVNKFYGCCLVVFYIFLTFIIPCNIFTLLIMVPYKRKIVIDEVRKTLVIFMQGIIGCCTTGQRLYDLNQIQKIRLFITSKPDPKIGFNKLYFINCEIYSLEGEKNALFVDIPYEEAKYKQFISFFQRHLDTEFDPLETIFNTLPKENDLVDITNSENENKMIDKPLIDGSAAIPISSAVTP